MHTQARPEKSSGPYHAGGRAVHERLDMPWQAGRVGQIIRPTIAPVVQAFGVVGSVDSHGSAWASLLNRRLGFLKTMGERRLRFHDDSENLMFNALGNLAANSTVGLPGDSDHHIDFDLHHPLCTGKRRRTLWIPVDARGAGDLERSALLEAGKEATPFGRTLLN